MQKPGPIELSWNRIDANGKAVPPGVYTYNVKGNISWEKRVISEDQIEVGSPSATFQQETRAWNRQVSQRRTRINWTFTRRKARRTFRYGISGLWNKINRSSN